MYSSNHEYYQLLALLLVASLAEPDPFPDQRAISTPSIMFRVVVSAQVKAAVESEPKPAEQHLESGECAGIRAALCVREL